MKKNIQLGWILSLVILISTLSLLNLIVSASDSSVHDKVMIQALFDKDYKPAEHENGKNSDIANRIQALEEASYLCVDEYNDNSTSKGKTDLASLKGKRINGKKINGLPRNIDEIDFSSNSEHRKYTHKGWDHDYSVEWTEDVDIEKQRKSNWPVRKKILLTTVNQAFDFGITSNYITGFSKQCNSLAAYIYYIHVLQDCIADKNVLAVNDVGLSTKYISGNIIPLGGSDLDAKRVNGVPEDMISQLKYHLGILFPSPKDTTSYNKLIDSMDKIDDDIKNLGNITTKRKADQYYECAERLKELLIEYVPNLLADEPYCKNVFYQ